VLPPLETGALQVTTAWVLPAVAVAKLGAPGRNTGVTAPEAADAALVPKAFVAVTVKVYGVPLASPVTTAVNVEPFTVALKPPGLEVAL
jgi:hypothetical protein